uniref:Uncharacterized protein n=1 Tax=Oryza barthii TaxID=65489 RepID=A0A0D3HMN3_9ORYZ
MKGTMQGVDCLPRVQHSWSMVGKGLTGDKVAVRTGFVPERIGDQSASNTETILIWFRLVKTMFKMPPVRLKVETLVSASLEKRQPASWKSEQESLARVCVQCYDSDRRACSPSAPAPHMAMVVDDAPSAPATTTHHQWPRCSYKLRPCCAIV